MRVKIGKTSDGAAIRLPKAVMEGLRLETGNEADIRITGGEMRLTAVKPARRITRAELIESMDHFGDTGQSETIAWGPDRGSEIIDDGFSAPSKTTGAKKRAS